jgi:hypothetical protein
MLRAILFIQFLCLGILVLGFYNIQNRNFQQIRPRVEAFFVPVPRFHEARSDFPLSVKIPDYLKNNESVINEIDFQIREVRQEIELVKNLILNESDPFEKRQLRDKENLLLNKENSLLDKENLLLNKENLLLDIRKLQMKNSPETKSGKKN